MNNEQGKIWYSLGLDNSQLSVDAEKAKNTFRNIGGVAEAEGSRMDNVFKNVAGSMAAVFTVQQAAMFAKSIVQVRGEIEALEISFETLLGNKEKANALFSEIRSYATNTPLELQPLAKGAQTLLSFNIEAEKVMPILKQIGDVSMGNSQKFESLILSFSQMSSTGKLMGQDLLQMINAGFNPLTVIAEKTGKSIGELRKDMEAGAISSQMVADAFATVTAEGGKFHGMLEKQSKGINGSISNLSGAIDDMFNDLGTKNQGFITGAISGTTTLVENYDSVLNILGVLITTYGAYKAVLITTEVIKQSMAVVRHTEEATQLLKLLSVEQQAKISKLGLSKTSLEYSTVVKAEIAANIQATQATLAKARTEVSAASQTVAAKRAEYVAAKALEKQRLAELMHIGASGTAKQVEIAQSRLATAEKARETAALQFQSATRDFNTKKITVESAAKSANSLATSTNTASQIGNVSATNILAAAKIRLTAIAARLNAVIMANPYAIAAAAIAALIYGVYKYATAETAAEMAQRKHNEALEAAKEKKDNLLSKTDQLINKINDETQTVYAQIKAWKELQKEMPEAFGKMTMQEFKNMKPDERGKLINKTLDDKEIKDAEDKLNAFSNYLEAYNKHAGLLLSGTNDQIQKSIKGMAALIEELKAAYPSDTKDFIFGGSNDRIKEYIELLKQEKTQLDENIQQAEFAAKSDSEKLTILNEQLKKYQEQSEETEKLVSQTERIGGAMNNVVVPSISNVEKSLSSVNTAWFNFDLQTQANISQLDFLNGKINETKNAIDAIKNANGNGMTYAQAKDDARKEYETAQKQLDEIKKNSTKHSKIDYENAVKSEEEKKKAYQSLGGVIISTSKSGSGGPKAKPKDYTADLARDKQEKAKAEKNLQSAADQARIDMMNEGIEKVLAQNELNYKKEKEQIKQQKDDLLKSIQEYEQTVWESKSPNWEKKKLKFKPQTTELSKEDQDLFTPIEEASKSKYDKANVEAFKSLNQYQTFAEKRKEIEEKFNKDIAELEAKNSDGRYSKNIEKAKKIKDKELTDLENSTDNLISRYRTFTEKRKEIEEKFNKDIAEMQSENTDGKYDGNIQEAEQRKKEALDAIDNEVAEREISFQLWSDKIMSMGLKRLQSALKTARIALKEDKNLSEKEKAVLRTQIKTLEKKVAIEEEKDNSLTSAEKAKKKWGTTLETMNEVQDSIGNIISGFEGMDEATKNVLSAATNIAGGVIAMIKGIEILATTSGKSIKAVEKASMILAIIGAAVKIITAIFSLASKAEKKHQETLKEVATNKIEMQQEYNLLLLEQNLLMKEATSIFGVDQISKAARALEVYRDAIAAYKKEIKGEKELSQQRIAFSAGTGLFQQQVKAYKEGMLALYDITVKTGHEKTGLFGWGKGKDTYTSILKLYPDLINGEKQLNIERAKAILSTQTMSDENKALLQDLINLQEKAAEAQEELKNYLNETFGDLGNNVLDAISDAIQNGTDAWEKFGDTGASVLEKLGKQIAYELFFSDKFKRLQADLEKLYGSGSSTEQIAEKARNTVASFYNGIGADMDAAQNWMEQWKSEAKEQGMELWKNTASREASSKGFASMSQDSAEGLDGKFTAVQGHTYFISENVKLLTANSAIILKHLAGIENNTSHCARLERIENDMGAAKNILDTINLKGITIRT